jgi:hypothetical protein
MAAGLCRDTGLLELYREAIAAGRLAFDGASACACLAANDGGGCDLALTDACFGAVRPADPEGRCVSSFDCGFGTCEFTAGVCPGRCRASEAPASSASRAMRSPRAGSACAAAAAARARGRRASVIPARARSIASTSAEAPGAMRSRAAARRACAARAARAARAVASPEEGSRLARRPSCAPLDSVETA